MFPLILFWAFTLNQFFASSVAVKQRGISLDGEWAHSHNSQTKLYSNEEKKTNGWEK